MWQHITRRQWLQVAAAAAAAGAAWTIVPRHVLGEANTGIDQASVDLMANFFASVRDRQQPISDPFTTIAASVRATCATSPCCFGGSCGGIPKKKISSATPRPARWSAAHNGSRTRFERIFLRREFP